MSKQPEALRWAEHLERHSHYIGQDLLIAAELRKLHALNGELLEALCALVLNHDAGGVTMRAIADARSVIDKAGEQP